MEFVKDAAGLLILVSLQHSLEAGASWKCFTLYYKIVTEL